MLQLLDWEVSELPKSLSEILGGRGNGEVLGYRGAGGFF
jgi:hypothetical protein